MDDDIPQTETNNETDMNQDAGSPSSYQGSSTSLGNNSQQRSRLNSGRGSFVQAVRRAFSIGGDYSVAEVASSDFDDEEFRPMNQQDRELESRYHNRKVVIGVLVVFFSVIIMATVRNKFRPSGHSGMTSETAGVCWDPFMNLRPSSAKEGFKNGAVAADHPLCSEIGVSVMRDQGGNAVDAAVTVALCLGVANPASSGMGGGAFILIHAEPVEEKTGKTMPLFNDARTGESPLSISGKVTEVIDCREVAPGAASTDLYSGEPETASVFGGLAIGVPGELRGLELAHARHGKLPWSEVVRPAMELAKNGVVVNENFAHEIQLMAEKYVANEIQDYGLRSLLTKRDNWHHPLLEGDLLINDRLGETLEAVMKYGADAIYRGERAAKIAEEIQSAGGIVTQPDIEGYRATLRSPVIGHDINGFSIAGVPPPSSGGAAVIGAARFLSGFSIPLASYSDTLSIHRIVEACKHVFAIRMSLSDPAYNSEVVAEAVNDLVGPHMEELRKETRDNATLPLSKYGGKKWAQLNDNEGAGNVSDAKEGDRRQLARRFGYLEDGGTSHFSVVDKDGNAVAMTTSVNTYFGSKVVGSSTGIVFSNTMDDFANPGRPNFFGLTPSPSNYIKPGKRPLSSMSPTMVFRKNPSDAGESPRLGDLVLIFGASGGPKIITALIQVFVNVVMLGFPPFDAVTYPRVHDQLIYHGAAVSATEKATLLQGPKIEVSKRTKDALSRRGHAMLDIDYAGTVQAIAVDLETETMSAVCDIRKGGSPSGY